MTVRSLERSPGRCYRHSVVEASQSSVIELKAVSKVFMTEDVETRALDEVDLTIGSGEYVSICGPSGAGKSTLLAILGLLDTPTEGDFLLDGSPVGRLSPRQRARRRATDIGFVFQSFNLIGELSVKDNVSLPLSYQTVGKKEREERVMSALRRVGMDHRANHRPRQLSGGQQQRVAVARALVTRPKVLLADEPTGNLDSKNGEKVMELLSELHEAGSTICVVTHDPRYSGLSERSLHLLDGRLVASPTTP